MARFFGLSIAEKFSVCFFKLLQIYFSLPKTAVR
jgi:hypothetical protein